MMRVLVVSAEAGHHPALAEMIGRFGHQVTVAHSGEQALQQAATALPDIVLLDVELPGMDGYETAPRLKSQADGIHLPIIFMTHLNDEQTLLRCLSVGGDDFLATPIEPIMLQAKLRSHFRLRELSRTLVEKNRSLAWHSARVQREHDIVEHILQNALSRNFLDYEHLQTYLSPATSFNGDLCLSASGPLGNLYVFMGDFTGHGLAPATGALPLSQAFFTMVERGVSVAEMAAEFNHRLAQLLPDDMFCAAFIAELSASGERLTYWNGGMPDALVLDQQQRLSKRLPASHMALGILADDDFDSRVTNLRLSAGMSLVLYTDGLIELHNSQQQSLSEQGLIDLLAAQPSLDIDRVVSAIEAFRGDTPQRDDVSLAILRCCATGIKEREPEYEHQGLPFQLQVDLTAAELRELDPVADVVQSLGQFRGIRDHRTTLYLLLAEAYNNALEHGILGLDSSLKEQHEGFERYYQLRQQRLATLEQAEISFQIRYLPQQACLHMNIRNSGSSWSPSVSARQQLATREYGRGLELMERLCDELALSDNGRCLSLVYSLNS
ncbi:PP2C family protein-serine/threonine phosphatase [Idiomarina xiamenensis]|uniref:Response regulator of sigma subunit, serine phosphatase (CheY-RsbU) n=1 Tax=Idiomarina xiamenensis 10-D-4 TaxID=740709 RepID=K2K932_9GAMM|nr:fused response regulator/phosphatase [Idiomarina xiamenensis]EKE84273.1 response regulator of sigma subunit, serine phosphatase (CheY-RsbU) [Idiomarina xiamenensis 10-D-4]